MPEFCQRLPLLDGGLLDGELRGDGGGTVSNTVLLNLVARRHFLFFASEVCKVALESTPIFTSSRFASASLLALA